ncbi:hypothetical protein EZV62_001799 [Acer yangbiense]|uniref:Retrotransposon gag domain-containing protein n=1 Tax=Acer yangbiense TaxID=1000413 RepID=A0A5C7IV66_9ROSI|nr:hypothetical protein EZV62_001799 [Acer yangbiense]
MSRRNQTVTRGESLRANEDANLTIRQLAKEAKPTMNLIARLLEQQNRLLVDMNRGGSNAIGRGNTGASDIEKVFIAIAFLDKQKVVFASFMLEDEADHWWDATSRILKTTLPINDHITWEMFKNAFNEKYFPDRVCFKMERDFLNLKQGSKSVTEYEEQFTSLSRFATQLIPDDESKGRHFLNGLHPDIRSKVEVLKLATYTDIVDRALIAERSLEECKKTHEVFKRNNQQGGFQNGSGFRHGTQFKKHNNSGNKGNEKSIRDTPFRKNFPPC